MQYATGNYIGFVDADDWIERDMYELLYEKMRTGKYDLVKCKYAIDLGKGWGNLPTDSRRDVECHFAPPRNGLYYSNLTDSGNCGHCVTYAVWSGLYKASMLRDNAICFPEHLAFEDTYFSGILQLYVESLYILDVVLYHYFFNLKSLTNAVNAKHHLDRLPVALMLVEEYKKRGAFEVYPDEIEKDFLEIFFIQTWQDIFTRLTYIPDVMNIMKSIILELFPNYRENPYLFKSGKASPLLELLALDDWRPEELEIVKEAYLQS